MNRGISKPLVRRVGAAKVCTYPLTWIFKISQLGCEFVLVPMDLPKKISTAGLKVLGSSLAGAIYLLCEVLHLPPIVVFRGHKRTWRN